MLTGLDRRKRRDCCGCGQSCHDVGLRKQHLGHHNSWDCWYFTLLYGFVCCTVLVLAVLTDGRWKLAATYCNIIRCWRDAVDGTRTLYSLQNAGEQHCKHHSDSGQQVSALLDNNLEVPAVSLLKISVLSSSGVCVDGYPFNTGSHTVLVQEFGVI